MFTMLKYNAAAFLITTLLYLGILPTVAMAFSVCDLQESFTYSEEISDLITTVNKNAEPYCLFWSPEWTFPVQRDSVKSILTTAINDVIKLSDKNTLTANHLLLLGALWHHLYQLEVDSAGAKADSIANNVIAQFPNAAFSARWLKGVNQIKQIHVQDGFNELDKLRMEDFAGKKSFIQEYIKLTNLCFLPSGVNSFSDTFNSPLNLADASSTLHMEDSELLPYKETWTAFSSENNPQGHSGFRFNAQYLLTNILRLSFSGLTSTSSISLDYTIDKNMVYQIRDPLIHNPDSPPSRMELNVTIDLSRNKKPIREYVSTIINNKFDIISEKKETSVTDAVSLRCYNKSIFRNVPDSYFALITFNRICYPRPDIFYSSTPEAIEPVDVRYIITLNTSALVDRKAEKILSYILEKFGGEKPI